MIRCLFAVSLLASCTVGDDEALDGTAGVSVSTTDQSLSGCHGHAATSVPANGQFVLTTFGGPGDHQAMSCGGYADGTTWYAASRQRYGCGAKLAIEANGKCVVVEALDYGPDVCVENAAGMPVLDASPKVSRALFDEAGAGWSDQFVVTVNEVAANTPLGPCTAGGGGGGGSAMACASSTLDREVDDGVCVQSAGDAQWYECEDGGWASRPSSSGCAQAFAFCSSATLGRTVPPRTCVQAASNGTWYQCNGQGWVTPVQVGTKQGPIGSCAQMYPL